MLANSDADCAVIATPTGVHFEQVQACLNAGKHCLVEKTAFASLEETRQVVELAQSRHLVVMEAFMFRFHAQFAALREYLERLDPGSIRMIDCRFGFPHLGVDDIRYTAQLAGGALNDCGAYTISSARALLGEGAQIRHAQVASEVGYAVDTQGLAILKDDSGRIASCSWMFGASYQNAVSIWCADRIIEVERAYSKPPTLETKITVRANGAVVETIAVPACNHFVAMLDAFADAVAQGIASGMHEEMLEQAKFLQLVRDSSC